jgi:hypothetical protein
MAASIRSSQNHQINQCTPTPEDHLVLLLTIHSWDSACTLPRHRPVLVGSRYLVVSRGSYNRSFRLHGLFLFNRFILLHGNIACFGLFVVSFQRSLWHLYYQTAIHFHVACLPRTLDSLFFVVDAALAFLCSPAVCSVLLRYQPGSCSINSFSYVRWCRRVLHARYFVLFRRLLRLIVVLESPPLIVCCLFGRGLD